MTIHPNRKKIYLQLIKSVVCEQNMKKKSNTGFIKRSSSTNTSYFQYCSKMPISTQRHTVWNNKNANSFREVIREKTLYNIILTKTATDLKTKLCIIYEDFPKLNPIVYELGSRRENVWQQLIFFPLVRARLTRVTTHRMEVLCRTITVFSGL